MLAIRDQVAPPTLNLDNPSAGCGDIDLVPHKAKERPMRRRAVELVRLRRHQRVADPRAGLTLSADAGDAAPRSAGADALTLAHPRLLVVLVGAVGWGAVRAFLARARPARRSRDVVDRSAARALDEHRRRAGTRRA